MRRTAKHILTAFLAVLLLVSGTMAVGVSAREQLNLKDKPDLNLKMQYPDEEGNLQPADVTVGLYPVALTRLSNGNQIYVKTGDFFRAKIDLKNITTEEELLRKVPVEAVEAHIADRHIRPRFQDATDPRTGLAHFEQLPAGLYLVRLEKPEDGPALYAMNSFLLTLPRILPNDEYDYKGEAVVLPKMQLSKELLDIRVIKAWANDKPENRPASITVQLMNGSQIADTTVLTKDNGWTWTFYEKPADVAWSVYEKKVENYKAKVGEMVLTDNGYEVIITNTYAPPTPLVQTGQLNWPLPFLVVGGLLLLILGYTMSREKKRKEN